MRLTKALCRYYSVFMVLFILGSCPLVVSAAPTTYQPANLNAFQKELTTVQQYINLEQDHYFLTLNALQSLLDLETKIHNSIHLDEEQLNSINTILKKITNTAATTNFYASLKEQRMDLLNRITSSNILLYNLTLAKKNLYTNERQNNPFNLKTKISPIWQHINATEPSGLTFNSSIIYQRSGLDILLKNKSMAGLIITLIISIIISFFSFKILSFFIDKNKKPGSDIHLLLQKIKPTVLFLYPLLLINIYLYFLFHSTIQNPTIVLIARSFFIYTLFITALTIDSGMNKNKRYFPNAIQKYSLLMTIILTCYNYTLLSLSFITPYISFTLIEYRFITYAVSALLLCILFLNRKREETIENKLWRPVVNRSIFIASIAFVCYLIFVLSEGQNIPETWMGLRNTVFIILYNVSLFWINWLVLRISLFAGKKSWRLTLIAKTTLTGLYLIPIIAAWNGYYHLALLWIPNIITTMMVVLTIIYLNRFLKHIYSEITNQKRKIGRKVYSLLGMKSDEKHIIQLFVIRFLLMTVPIFIAFIALNEIWGMVLYDADLIYKSFKNGIAITEQITLYPARIIRSAFLFCIIILLGRVFSNAISKKIGLSYDNQTKFTIKSLMNFSIFIMAIGFSLFVSGFDASEFMFIMGGLSIGIGLGLKQFVSDAGSGLYILFEKPFKLGNHIKLNIYGQETEGLVKKTGFLSTQITISDHSDVIIPNSTVLSNPIVNYTFLNNKLYRLDIIVTLGNMSDLEQAQVLLLDIAGKNPHVIQSPPYQPSVFLDINQIHLECEVNGIEQKIPISSELIARINDVFREKGITITFVK